MGKGRKILCLILLVSLLASLFSACEEESSSKKRRRPRDEEEDTVTAFSMEDLVGSWSVKTEQYEATLVFREEDEVFEATWTVFDFGKDVWGEETFQIKEISGYTMVGLMPDGQIKYFTFAPFGQTLYFDGMYYTNPEKNLGLPEDTAKFAFIRDGAQATVMHHVFLGMTYDEVKRNYRSVGELEAQSAYRSFAYSATTYDVDDDVPNHDSSWAYFRFDAEQKLVQTYLHLYRSEYRTASYTTIKTVSESWLTELTEKYGEYTMTERTFTHDDGQHVYHTYRWELGNIVCELELDGIDTVDNLDGVTLTYTLKGYE